MVIYEEMKAKMRRRLFFIAAYGLVALGAVSSLLTNMKTVPLIENRQKALLKTQGFERENRRLEFLVISANRLTNIDKKALQQGLRPTKKVIYIPAL
jgi:hypothetical protein